MTLVYLYVYALCADSREDLLLGNYWRLGSLGAGLSYSQQALVPIPNAIFGNYSIIVITDVYNDVYEYTDEDDNSRVSMVGITIVRD